MVGMGCPDLLVGYEGENFLLEVKADDREKLNQNEYKWHRDWHGQVATVYTRSGALKAIGALRDDP